jgi:DnaJ-class molecular chaperone
MATKTANLPIVTYFRGTGIGYIQKSGVSPCRRCSGTGTDPDGTYPCLLCHGSKEEYINTNNIKVCSTHLETRLVPVAQYYSRWEGGNDGLMHDGYFDILGCPICKIPVYCEL